MLNPDDQTELRFLVDRVMKGSVSREDWSTLAALMVIAQGETACAAIAARGLDEFIAVAGPIYEGHAFQYRDYRRIYERICAASASIDRSSSVH